MFKLNFYPKSVLVAQIELVEGVDVIQKGRVLKSHEEHRQREHTLLEFLSVNIRGSPRADDLHVACLRHVAGLDLDFRAICFWVSPSHQIYFNVGVVKKDISDLSHGELFALPDAGIENPVEICALLEYIIALKLFQVFI